MTPFPVPEKTREYGQTTTSSKDLSLGADAHEPGGRTLGSGPRLFERLVVTHYMRSRRQICREEFCTKKESGIDLVDMDYGSIRCWRRARLGVAGHVYESCGNACVNI